MFKLIEDNFSFVVSIPSLVQLDKFFFSFTGNTDSN